MIRLLPLFPGLPGGPEVLVLLFTLVVVLVIPIGISVAIYRGASRRNSRHAVAWGLAAFFGGVVVWILYLVVRDEMG